MEGGKKQSQVSPSGARRQWAAAVGVAADDTVMGLYITGDRVKTDTRDAECVFSKSPAQLVPVIDGLA